MTFDSVCMIHTLWFQHNLGEFYNRTRPTYQFAYCRLEFLDCLRMWRIVKSTIGIDLLSPQINLHLIWLIPYDSCRMTVFDLIGSIKRLLLGVGSRASWENGFRCWWIKFSSKKTFQNSWIYCWVKGLNDFILTVSVSRSESAVEALSSCQCGPDKIQ